MGEERRRDARIRVAFQVLRAIPPIEGVAWLADASAGGAHLKGTSARPPLGERVRLTVRLPEAGAPHELSGSVVRHAEDGFGVEFEKPVPEIARLTAEEPLAVPTAAALARPRSGLTPVQEIAVDCCVGTQWSGGRVCLPLRRTLLDHLNQGEPFVRMVDVTTPHAPGPLAFVAMRRDALDLVVPVDTQEGIEKVQQVGSFVRRELRVLMPYAVVEGSLEVLERIRVSDHLMRCGSFVALRDCRVRLAPGQPAPRDLSRVPVLLVNVRRVLGVADLAASPPPDDPAPSS